MSYSLGIPNLTNSYIFKDLQRIDAEERKDRETRVPLLAYAHQNQPQFQKIENLSRNYVRSGQQKFADPFPYVSRPINWYYHGRKLDILQSLEANRKTNYPEVITKYPLKVVGFY